MSFISDIKTTIKKFFKPVSVFFSNLWNWLSNARNRFFKSVSSILSKSWNWLSSIFTSKENPGKKSENPDQKSKDPGKKSAYFINTSYWLNVEQRVTALLKKSSNFLDVFFSKKEQELNPDSFHKINSLLEKLSAFAEGKEALLKIDENGLEKEDADLLQAFKKTQEAHFILSLVAEMNIKGLDEVYASEKEKPADWVTFEKLFRNIREKTKIKRDIFTADFMDDAIKYTDDKNNSEYKFVIFGVAPDGFCVGYCLNMWDRKEMTEEFVRCLTNPAVKIRRRNYLKSQILSWCIDNSEDAPLAQLNQELKAVRVNYDSFYESDEKFVKFIQDNLSNKTWWLNSTLSSAFFSAMTEEARQLMIWSLTPTNKLQFQSSSAAKKSNNSPYHRLHYLSTGFHASSIVEMGDFPQLITGKRYENRFRICQTAKDHTAYMKTWVEAQRPKCGM